ncbi:replication protein A 70 kDa DNA-binding subunit C-like [Panicum miliaceum]|uniref:Replication protein A 70 kDa DNA-binding subunit C-like n=1 Tax=Panicum miliaceum TaxID=4540 RepID=A0A3L6RA98_PANMI|nr:replication protein A 70 kDa DNA-binding subunit C-like [Panicum miliaceum]
MHADTCVPTNVAAWQLARHAAASRGRSAGGPGSPFARLAVRFSRNIAPGRSGGALHLHVRFRVASQLRACEYVPLINCETIIVIQLQILQPECALIGSLKLYEPTRKSGGFSTRSMRYAPRPDCEPYYGGQHIHQSCIASEAEERTNFLSYNGPFGRSSLPGRATPCSLAPLAEPAAWKTVGQIKDEYLGYFNKPDFITVKADISFISNERFRSAACALVVNGKRCNVEASGNVDGECQGSCWEFGSSMVTYSGLSDLKGCSAARSSNSSHAISPGRARRLCSADRYGQQVNEVYAEPSALSAFGACGWGRDHGSDIDGQRSPAPDGPVGRFYGASPGPGVNIALDVCRVRSPRTSAHGAERSPGKP